MRLKQKLEEDPSKPLRLTDKGPCRFSCGWGRYEGHHIRTVRKYPNARRVPFWAFLGVLEKRRTT